MINLAGEAHCDETIRLELESCRIPIVEILRTRNEVPYSLIGKLGQFTFKRAWYYWIVKGDVPLSVAKELYANPVGKKYVRVDGHCGCPAPEWPWVQCFSLDGKLVLPLDEQKTCEKALANPKSSMHEICQAVLDRSVFVEDPNTAPVQHVTMYHIDSEEGLKLFVDTMIKHGLVNWKIPKLVEVLESSRSKFHGLQAAIGCHLEDPDEYPLELNKLKDSLQEGNKKASAILTEIETR